MAQRKYLDGYLSILPEEERREVLSRIKSEQPGVFANVDFEQYNELVEQIAKERQLATVVDEQIDILDSTKHNKFFSSVYTDLNVLFNELELIRIAINNYEKLADTQMAELQAEADLLRANVQETASVINEGDSSITFATDFSYASDEELDRETFQFLFTDRDGTLLPPAQMKNDKIYISESKQENNERIKLFKPSIVTEVTPGKDIKNHELIKMIDDNDTSSWLHEISSSAKIDSGIGKHHSVGALCLVKLDFGYAMPLNDISILFDGSHAPDIAYISYAAGKYIYVNKKFNQDTGAKGLCDYYTYDSSKFTRDFSFPLISTNALEILIRQPNYTQYSTQPPKPKEEWITYKVKKGDCLSRIGKKFGVPWRTIAKLNNVSGPKYMIFPGQIFKIRLAVNLVKYKVVRGDSLSKIGRKFGVDWREIAKLNGISSPYTIYTGQILNIEKK